MHFVIITSYIPLYKVLMFPSVLPACLPAWLLLGDHVRYKKFWELIGYVPLIKYRPHRKRRVQQFFYFCVCIRWCGEVFTEPLRSKDREYTYRHYRLRGIYEVAAEIVSGAMIHIPSFIKIGSGIQNLIRGIQTYGHKDWRGHTDSMMIA
jgi:hypothetical protein